MISQKYSLTAPYFPGSLEGLGSSRFLILCECCLLKHEFLSWASLHPTSVLHLWQDQFDMVSDADLQALDVKIVALTAKVQCLQQSCRHMEAGRTG